MTQNKQTKMKYASRALIPLKYIQKKTNRNKTFLEFVR